MSRFKIYTLLALFLFTLTGAASAQIGDRTPAALSTIHGIPDLPMPADVYVNGTYQTTFDFGESTGPVRLDAGIYEVEIRLGEVTLLVAKAELAVGSNSTMVAHLDEDGGPRLSVFENDLSSLSRDEARLTVRHTAQAPKVDVRLIRAPGPSSARTFGGANTTTSYGWLTIRGLGNSGQIGPIEVRAGSYTASVLVDRAEILNTGTLALSDNASYTVYVIGRFNDSLKFFVQRFDSAPR